MYGDCRKMKLRIRRIPWFTRISWFNCHWKNLTLRSRETPGVFGGSGKGSLPKWRKATKLVVQMVLHFFLYVFIYLHFGKLIDIAMEWVLWRISYWTCVYSIAMLYSLPEVPLLMRYLGFFTKFSTKTPPKSISNLGAPGLRWPVDTWYHGVGWAFGFTLCGASGRQARWPDFFRNLEVKLK